MADQLTKLQSYINEHIPLSIALGVEVKEAGSNKVILAAPLLANINHKSTAFGGSIYSLATLACWSLVFLNLNNYNYPAEIVISAGKIKYLKPITTDFSAECNLESKTDLEKFVAMLAKKGKARITLSARVYQNNIVAADFAGEFVALRSAYY